MADKIDLGHRMVTDEARSEWKTLQAAYKELADHLRPGVYGFGFLEYPAVMY